MGTRLGTYGNSDSTDAAVGDSVVVSVPVPHFPSVSPHTTRTSRTFPCSTPVISSLSVVVVVLPPL